MQHRVAVVAGTFDHIHIGHKLMISKAFELADHIIIGIVRDEAINDIHKICREKVEPYDQRVSKVVSYIKFILKKRNMEKKTFEIIGIKGPYDVVLDKNRKIDYIIVSDETLPRAVMINILRLKKGLEKLKIVTVPIMRDKLGRPISSHRFRTGEIKESEEVEKNC